ncbi:hypothetical protein Dxin01_03976 [Deinococcus xinjiangensis]|uniref:HTH cro/C1-type domain-containing protein n=1 Tax=Deinococcus xinjiangensis TaxID=457454 RepID=A0ABP9VG77_9DEIO
MDTPTPTLGARLREARDRTGLDQQAAATALNVDRVNLSYWENDRRTPGLAHLQRLAEVYSTTVDYLLGATDEPSEPDHHAALYAHLTGADKQASKALKSWLTFLDDWADLRSEVDGELPGRGQTFVPEGRVAEPVTDSRRAPALAVRTRELCHLGLDAIPDLMAFLDSKNILVCRKDMGKGSDVSGMFYNHPRLGFCILVNSGHQPGRQQFTMAHEMAHALFHHQERGLISRASIKERREKFADTFAAHFLVPTEALRKAVERCESTEAGAPLDPYDVVRMQREFRVSYAMLLLRLYSEGFIDKETFDRYQQYSPRSLAERLSINTDEFQKEYECPPELATYSPSIIDTVFRYLQDGSLSVPAAASLLDVPQEVVSLLLRQYDQAHADEMQEYAQLPSPEQISPRFTRNHPKASAVPSRRSSAKMTG